MKRLLVFPLLLLTLVCQAQFMSPSYGELSESPAVAGMREVVRYVSSAALEGRAAGSEGEAEAASYMSEVLASRGADVLSGKDGELFGIRAEGGDTLRSHNVIAFIPGSDRTLKDKYIVIGARLDNLGTSTVNVDGRSVERVYYGANGNGSGLAALAALAEKLSKGSLFLGRSVILAAFGSSMIDNAGSWYFLNRSFPDAANIDAMVNLDMLGTGSGGFYAYTSSNADLNATITSLESTLQPVHPKIVGKEPCASDHRSFYGKGIPSVMFTTGMYPEYNSIRDTESIIEYDWLEREVEYIYNFVVELSSGRAPEFMPSQSSSRKTGRSSEDVIPFYECDYRPVFLGSQDPATFLNKWVYVYLRYPESAVKEGVRGKVTVRFVIDEKGHVTDVRAVKGPDPRLEEEAVRVVSSSPDWKPGRLNGKKVACEMSIDVEFRLERKK